MKAEEVFNYSQIKALINETDGDAFAELAWEAYSDQGRFQTKETIEDEKLIRRLQDESVPFILTVRALREFFGPMQYHLDSSREKLQTGIRSLDNGLNLYTGPEGAEYSVTNLAFFMEGTSQNHKQQIVVTKHPSFGNLFRDAQKVAEVLNACWTTSLGLNESVTTDMTPRIWCPTEEEPLVVIERQSQEPLITLPGLSIQGLVFSSSIAPSTYSNHGTISYLLS